MCTFACEHLRACVRACVRAFVRACVRACVRAKPCDVREVIYDRQRLCYMCKHVCSRIQCYALTGARMTCICKPLLVVIKISMQNVQLSVIGDLLMTITWRLPTLLLSLMAYAIRQLYMLVQV